MMNASSPVFGPPTLTLAEWTAALSGSPVAPDAAALYAQCVAAGMDPAVALGQFAAESSYGTAGYATVTHSWGNQTWATWEAQFGATAYAPGNGYTYALYPSWDLGLQAYLHLMGLYRGWGWAGSLGQMCAYWLSGSGTITARVTRYVNNIIAAVQSAQSEAGYLPAFQSERGDPDGQIDDCTPRSTGMLLDWMTHGTQTGADLPDKPGGDDLASMAAFAQAHYGLDIGCLYATPPTFAQLQAVTGGMVIQGLYGAVPAPYNRFDPTFTGGHAVFALHTDAGFFVMDPLAPADGTYHGEIWPDAVVSAYAYGLSGNQTVLCAVPPTEDQVITLTGSPGWYDAPIGSQIYQLDGVTPLTKLDYYPPSTGIYSPGATSASQRAILIDHGAVKGMLAIMNDADLTARSSPTPAPTPVPAPTVITQVIPAPLLKFLTDAFQGAVAGLAAVNIAPYLPIAGSHFTLTGAETLAAVLGVAAFDGLMGRVGADLPALFGWLSSITKA